MITISENTARSAIEAIKEYISGTEGSSNYPDLYPYREALSDLEDQIAGWKNSIDEIPPRSALGERFIVRLDSREEIKAILIKCHNNSDDQLFSRLGTKDDDISFTSQVIQWRYDD